MQTLRRNSNTFREEASSVANNVHSSFEILLILQKRKMKSWQHWHEEASKIDLYKMHKR